MKLDGPNQPALSYSCQTGDSVSPSRLQRFLTWSYQEQDPPLEFPSARERRPNRAYLTQFVDQYLGPDHRVWWANCREQPDPTGCLWLGYTVDATDGDRHPYIFLVYVAPEYRRRGIGTALISQAENWARQQGYRKLALHVLCANVAGRQLYQQLDYQAQSVLMEKTL